MNCMKCGVEIPEQQVFCDHCLQIMGQYPVKSDVHIQLPKRSSAVEAVKKPGKKKRSLSQEELISSLTMRVLRLRLTVVVLIFLLLVSCGLFAINLYQQYNEPVIGKNYTIDTTIND